MGQIGWLRRCSASRGAVVLPAHSRFVPTRSDSRYSFVAGSVRFSASSESSSGACYFAAHVIGGPGPGIVVIRLVAPLLQVEERLRDILWFGRHGNPRGAPPFPNPGKWFRTHPACFCVRGFSPAQGSVAGEPLQPCTASWTRR